MLPAPRHKTQELNLQRRKYVAQTTRILNTQPIRPSQTIKVDLNDLPLRKTIHDVVRHADTFCPMLYELFQHHDEFELFIMPPAPAQELLVRSKKVNNPMWEQELGITHFYHLALPAYKEVQGKLHFLYYSPEHIFGNNGIPIRYSNYDFLADDVISLPAIEVCGRKFHFCPENKPQIYRSALWFDQYIRQHYMGSKLKFEGASYKALMARGNNER